MIPQNLRDILSNEQYTGLFQTIALIIFMLFFIGLIIYVFNKPKKHYDEAAHTPLEDDEKPFNL
ncbi:cbb3-type cytochrome oxidase subunit 3 [Chryseobacterium taklimakanense]|uniref:Cbb3-type cytochrome c oxidase subunit 3 n=1 Tax=Chryseobacterium taklimakanense TaxID=536441 RepID=A0A239XF86_9FLAO|nr:cbb3-type cytochrome c oxidase subunit 3 [Chryseobacterium taklimakanense]AZI19526.1 cbb3-type cytochrome c oxidase subunit 3 [Chryseobacterium taklimakanense]SNV44644.1 Cbb3-type cytochrome oxidase, subunit 3 [Chryseobacterium taklimakanense]